MRPRKAIGVGCLLVISVICMGATPMWCGEAEPPWTQCPEQEDLNALGTRMTCHMIEFFAYAGFDRDDFIVDADQLSETENVYAELVRRGFHLKSETSDLVVYELGSISLFTPGQTVSFAYVDGLYESMLVTTIAENPDVNAWFVERIMVDAAGELVFHALEPIPDQ